MQYYNDYNDELVNFYTEIKNENFAHDLINLKYVNNESVMYLFAKYSKIDAYFPQLSINLLYLVNTSQGPIKFYFTLNQNEVVFNEVYVLNYNSNKTNIINNVKSDKKFKFPVEFPNLYDNPNYVKNMYFTINFSQTATFYDKGLEFIHPIFRDVIKERFPSFYESKYSSRYIEMGNSQLRIIHMGCIAEEEQKMYKTPIPKELNNVFINVSKFIYELNTCSKDKEDIKSYITIKLYK